MYSLSNISYMTYNIYKEGFTMAVDKEKNKQFLLTISIEMLEAIEAYWHEKNLPNRNEAVRQLITIALQKEQQE